MLLIFQNIRLESVVTDAGVCIFLSYEMCVKFKSRKEITNISRGEDF